MRENSVSSMKVIRPSSIFAFDGSGDKAPLRNANFFRKACGCDPPARIGLQHMRQSLKDLVAASFIFSVASVIRIP